MTEVLCLSHNTQGYDYIVGDLHGCVDDLYQKLRTVSFDQLNDRLFSVGDLIDRGPSSVRALELLNEPWFLAVRGNHEELMIRSVLHKDVVAKSTWLSNGGEWSLDVPLNVLTDWADRLSRLPYAIAVGQGQHRFNVIHAEFFGTDRNLDAGRWSDDVRQQLLWGRSLFKGNFASNCQEGLSTTYCGHTIVEKVTACQQQINVDTGAYKQYEVGGSKGFLTIVRANTPR